MKPLRRIIIFVLVMALLLVEMPVQVQAKYAGIDYSRIYGSNTSTSYDVDCEFGPVSVIGKLRYTGKFTDEEIDEEIADTLKWMQITEVDIQNAHQVLAE